MRVFTANFIDQYKHATWPVSRIINIHPSLLPSFPGTNAYREAFSYGVRFSGVTTHFVDEGVDSGVILNQRIFERKKQDTLDQFQNRGLQEEYLCYRETLLALATGRVSYSKNPFQIFINPVEQS